EALDRYGTDKPDLRFEMLLHDLSDVFAATEVKAFSAPTVKALRVSGGASFSRARLDELTDYATGLGAKGLAWFRITDEGLDSPLAKFLNETERAAMASVDGAQVGDIVFCVADEYPEACHVSALSARPSDRRRSARGRINTCGSRSFHCSRASTRTAIFRRRTIPLRCRTPTTWISSTPNR